jgi:hypothetical protein
MPALLMTMSIWKRESALVKFSFAAEMRAVAPAGVPTSAWTGTARML